MYATDGGGERGPRGHSSVAGRARRGRERGVGLGQHTAHVRLRRRPRGLRARVARKRRQRRGPQRERPHAAHGGATRLFTYQYGYLIVVHWYL